MRIVPYNDHDDATLTVNVTLPSGFEAENTQNAVRSDVLRTSDTTTLVITGVLTASRVANCFFIFRHLLNGASVRLQLFTDSGASVAASGGDSGTNPIVWWTAAETYSWSNATNDRFASESGYRYYFAADVTYLSYKLTISGTPTSSSYYQASRIFIGRYMELARSPDFGMQLGYKDLTRTNRTQGGSRRSYVGEGYRTLTGNLNYVKAAELSTWVQIHRQSGTGRDLVVDPFPADTTAKGRDHLMNACFSSIDAIGNDVSRFTKRFQFEEV